MNATRRVLVVLCLAVYSVCAAAFAQPTRGQESSSPLLEMLAYVPSTLEIRNGWTYYMDFRAVEDARDWLEKPESLQALLDADESLNFTYRWLSAPQSVANRFRELVDMPSVVGFDFYNIDRTLSFGEPPANGVIWQGNFDAQRIADAHTARGYEQTEIGGFTAWCAVEGCDAGLTLDPTNRELANVFDTGLGRKVPFLITPDYLISSPTVGVLEAAARTANGRSLADDRAFRTLTNAITDPEQYSGQLVNMHFFGTPLTLVEIDLTRPRNDLFIRNFELLAVEMEGYGDLPMYEYMAFADRQEGDDQVAIIALVYSSEADATTGANEVANRLPTFNDVIVRGSALTEPLITTSSHESAEFEGRVYADSETGKYAAVIEVRYDTPTQEQETAGFSLTENNARSPALVYNQMLQSVYARGFYPVWVIRR
jgi:hypothetical protein